MDDGFHNVVFTRPGIAAAIWLINKRQSILFATLFLIFTKLMHSVRGDPFVLPKTEKTPLSFFLIYVRYLC